jgi:rare lipoprotein A
MIKNKIFFFYIYTLCSLFFLTDCSRTCVNKYDSRNYLGHYKVGIPYKIKGQWYQPKIDTSYDEVGVASWYGTIFHCRQTANHEIFNKEQISAAHKTLPLPSVVTVTNLKNGKSLKVIVNDRGPFVDNRIIDLSEKAAEKIDMKKDGVAKVRVKYEHDQTVALHKKLGLKPNYKKIQSINLANKFKVNTQKISKIIVANFSTKKDATASANLIKHLGKPVIYREDKNNKTYYKLILNIAYFHDKSENYIMNQIIKLGYKKARLIK